jgi:hypothetical protein
MALVTQEIIRDSRKDVIKPRLEVEPFLKQSAYLIVS